MVETGEDANLVDTDEEVRKLLIEYKKLRIELERLGFLGNAIEALETAIRLPENERDAIAEVIISIGEIIDPEVNEDIRGSAQSRLGESISMLRGSVNAAEISSICYHLPSIVGPSVAKGIRISRKAELLEL